MARPKSLIYLTKTISHSQSHQSLNTFFFWRKIKTGGKVGVGERNMYYKSGGPHGKTSWTQYYYLTKNLGVYSAISMQNEIIPVPIEVSLAVNKF